MTFQIQAVTIYGKQPGQMRTVPFRTGTLNIVTGDSRRGKSALLTIIDYCLASSDYPVKAGKIRRYVSTFAITLVKPGRQLLVARRAPQGNSSTSTTLCVLTQAPGTPPPPLDELRFVTPLDAAKDLLSDFCGIDRTVRLPAVGKAVLIPPSVRHALFFCFQAQNEIANPAVLFHSQGEDWKSSTIRGVLPYFLGAVDREQALLRNRLTFLRRDLADNTAKLAAARDLAPATGQAHALLAEAIEVDLLPPTAPTRALGRRSPRPPAPGTDPDEHEPRTGERRRSPHRAPGPPRPAAQPSRTDPGGDRRSQGNPGRERRLR
ncbi:hypothetical protein [Embleya scabrispora]|uniref:hypothetical protein n=1 Tax=Embleya scabrispora TaxID=159449 RepID=UPI0003A461D1|nr:hypothetical protein [Embleya scabrispora]MYS84623.1 hypothetical protein [Streptomyces sp. SID5474]